MQADSIKCSSLKSKSGSYYASQQYGLIYYLCSYTSYASKPVLRYQSCKTMAFGIITNRLLLISFLKSLNVWYARTIFTFIWIFFIFFFRFFCISYGYQEARDRKEATPLRGNSSEYIGRPVCFPVDKTPFFFELFMMSRFDLLMYR